MSAENTKEFALEPVYVSAMFAAYTETDEPNKRLDAHWVSVPIAFADVGDETARLSGDLLYQIWFRAPGKYRVNFCLIAPAGTIMLGRHLQTYEVEHQSVKTRTWRQEIHMPNTHGTAIALIVNDRVKWMAPIDIRTPKDERARPTRP